jgi:hypothetical protein
VAILAGLTNDNVLALFDQRTPDQVKFLPVTGLDGTLIGIDRRPANGLLYGLTTTNRLYTINGRTGAATLASTLSEPFNAGAVSGFDFNPVADRLRLVGDNGQNFRINVDTGAVIVDGAIAFGMADANAGRPANVTASAYTNSVAGATATQLFNLDGLLDTLLLQDPPNDGGLRTIAPLSADLGAIAGFEIISGPGGSNAPLVASNGRLHSLDLTSGAISVLGTIGNGSLSLLGLSEAPAEAIAPRLSADTRAFALTENNTILAFSPLNPSATTAIAIGGLEGNLLGIDVRPADGQLYGITTTNGVYRIDPTSGAAILVSTLSEPFDAGAISGFDFNPVPDRLRLVGDTNTNFRINVDTGAVIVDGSLAFAADSDLAALDPNVTAAAYTNSVAGATTTALYVIDPLEDRLLLQSPPNDGVLQTVGDLGVDFDAIAGFDILRTPEGEDLAYAVSNSTLYSIDLLTGQAFEVGPVGDGQANTLQGFAIAGGSGQFTGRLDGDGTGPFDPLQYIASHDDLIGTFGVDPVSGALHFEQFGRAENRAIDQFDELRYLASYPDLIGAFGADVAQATAHFIRVGASEGRTDDRFNPVSYLNNFADLRQAFGNDFVAATRHYIQIGLSEGRSDR